tara:strand:- start:283 stop:810 length:528 start_codon:yes stop_codon:yes gene_type:complete
MLSIKCEDKFFKEKLISLFRQKKLLLENEYSNKFFFGLNFTFEENFLICQLDRDILKFKIPKNFNDIFEKIFDLISNKNINIKNYDYYPYKQIMKKGKKSIFLSEIQNMILSNLLINSNGIEKIELIKNIWPNDKDIFFNKLDTHLTNLKNQLAEDIGFDLNFSSKSGILKLCID